MGHNKGYASNMCCHIGRLPEVLRGARQGSVDSGSPFLFCSTLTMDRFTKLFYYLLVICCAFSVFGCMRGDLRTLMSVGTLGAARDRPWLLGCFSVRKRILDLYRVVDECGLQGGGRLMTALLSTWTIRFMARPVRLHGWLAGITHKLFI